MLSSWTYPPSALSAAIKNGQTLVSWNHCQWTAMLARYAAGVNIGLVFKLGKIGGFFAKAL
jgi:hypothetical protein